MRFSHCLNVLFAATLCIRSCLGNEDDPGPDCPPETCPCLPIAVHDAPGIGFDLALDYAAAAVHYHNGTSKELIDIAGTDSYKELMYSLAKLDAPIEWSWRERLQQYLNKMLGRPSTRYVAVLCDMIGHLKAESQSKLGKQNTPDKVVVTRPMFPALTEQMINEAIQLEGLRPWLPGPGIYIRSLSESRAAFAANGFGLCERYKNIFACGDETSNRPLETVYFVALSRGALYTSVDRYRAAFGLNAENPWPESYRVHQDAGTDSIERFATPDQYWSYVTDRLTLTSDGPPITSLLLGGQNSTMPELRRALKNAMARTQTDDAQLSELTDARTVVDPVHPLSAAAKGAALYARWRQEAPYYCVEDPECEEDRRRHRQSTRQWGGNLNQAPLLSTLRMALFEM